MTPNLAITDRHSFWRSLVATKQGPKGLGPDRAVGSTAEAARTMVNYRRNILPFIAGFGLASLLGGVFFGSYSMYQEAGESIRDAPQTPQTPPPQRIFEEPKSKFNELASRMYDEATSPINNTGHRKKYHLKAMRKGTGGLADSDRMLLGDIYYNSTSVCGKRKE